MNKKINQFDNKITNKLLDYIALDNIIEERIKKEFSSLTSSFFLSSLKEQILEKFIWFKLFIVNEISF